MLMTAFVYIKRVSIPDSFLNSVTTILRRVFSGKCRFFERLFVYVVEFG